MMTDLAFRTAVLRHHGARDGSLQELLRYTERHFDLSAVEQEQDPPMPLPDEDFAGVWDDYVAESRRTGVWRCLRGKLVQLRFPVTAGMSEDPDYRAATRRGVTDAFPARVLEIRDPEGLELAVHPTAAGRIPVLTVREREDFVTLVRALTRRNEPAPIPAAQGACIVAGYNNWDRVDRARAAWQRRHPGAGAHGWAAEFRRIARHKELYQDRFIILSDGPYSGVPAHDMRMEPAEWRALSLRIRREHECAHYFTRRVFGSMKNALHDELIADYMGITLATGSFRADWFLRFMGLDDEGAVRSDGRLHSYRGTPPLSDAAFRVLQALVRSAARGMAALDPLRGDAGDLHARGSAILALARSSVEELAAAGSGDIRPSAISGRSLALSGR